MRFVVALAVGLAGAATAAAQTQGYRYPSAREVQLRDIAANILVTPENRTDVLVSIENSEALPQARMTLSGRRLVVDGRVRGAVRSCQVQDGTLAVTTRQGVRLEGGALPTVRLRVPQDVVIAANGSFNLRLAAAQSVHLRLDGCGTADVERVEDDLETGLAGRARLRVDEAGEATLSLAGESEAALGFIREGLTASIAGEGKIDAHRVDGPVSIAITGDGAAGIRDGRAETLSIVIIGDGGVDFGGVAQALDAALFGGGAVRVARVEGERNQRIFGSGTVTIGQ